MKLKILLVTSFSFLLSGCLGDLLDWGCEYSDDEGHCYQSSAIQDSEPERCGNVTSHFTGSNPPKDKCYLLIAENTGDPSVCDNIVGGPASYTQSECLQNVLQSHTPESCLEAENEAICRTAYAHNGRGCGQGFKFKGDDCEVILEVVEEELETEIGETSKAEQADIDTLVEAVKGEYMDWLEADIELEIDPGKKAGLEAYRGFLQKAGETMESAQASLEKLNEIKRVFISTYDSKNDIENISVEAELDPGLFDQMKDRLWGSESLTGIKRENAEAKNSLTIYAAMLEQQAENDFLKKDKVDRLSSTIIDKFKHDVTEEVTEKSKALAEGLAGTAFMAVTQIGEALQAFQAEAQKQMFLGLARAYNRRREALLEEQPNLTPDEAHARAVQQVKEAPYRDNTNTGFIKHGNILENTDCQDSGNPLCIDNRVWWTAMDKTFRYNQKNP
jgi:hypothetical protein